MRFHVDACAPRQPQAKGKVERRVRDQRQALDSRGQVFADLAALQAWTDRRLEELAGERRCPASGTSVAEAWARERALLTPLPEPPHRSRSWWWCGRSDGTASCASRAGSTACRSG